MDDKHMIVEGELLQSKINYALENLNRAKVFLSKPTICQLKKK